MRTTEAAELRRRAEKRLGWAEGASNRFSLPTLREFVRAASPKLYYLLGECLSCGTDSCEYAWFVWGTGRGNRYWRVDA